MGNNQSSVFKINYEDIIYVLKNKERHILINTLPENNQECLLPSTIDIATEEKLINNCIQNGRKDIKIVLYGKNSNDESVYNKQRQLQSLGFYNIYIYTGGLFEWLMLQDIFGEDEFPTTKKELDILKYKPKKIMDIHLIDY